MISSFSYRRAALPFAALLSGAILLKFVFKISFESPTAPQDWRTHRCHNAESLLAAGELLPLNEVDIYSLELIKGLSDTLAIKILNGRESIHRIAEYLRPGEKHRAFEVIHGIGNKTAQKLSRYLDPLPDAAPAAREPGSIYALREADEDPGCIRNPA